MLITTHLVKGFDIGLNNNLYGGRMLDWIDESGALFTRELFPKEKFVTLKIAETIFHHPVKSNDVIKFFVVEPCGGKTSLSFKIVVKRNEDVVLTTDMVFVCVSNEGNKKAYNPYNLDCNIFKEITFNRAKRFYNNNNSYHNIDHIIDLLEQLDRIKLTRMEYNILCSAICYHDCIYIPGAEENEADSADVMIDNICPCKETEMSAEIISSTSIFSKFRIQSNIGDKKYCAMLQKLSDIMHDLDYSYFLDYEKLYISDEKIRNEYLTFIQKDKFDLGRRDFLIKLLDVDIYRSIYKNENNKAKDNITKLLNEKYKD